MKEFMRIVKRTVKKRKKNDEEEGSVIIETDRRTHKLTLNKRKLNVGWKKCPLFNRISVKKCFKCWGYFYIAKKTRDETCHKCAGKYKAFDCGESKKRCVNCMLFKI